MKVIWPATAIIGVVVTMGTGYRPWGDWLLLAAPIPFNIIWIYYRRQLRDIS